MRLEPFVLFPVAVLELLKGLKHEPVLLLWLLSHRNHVTGRCDPSLPTLAAETGLSRTTVWNTLNNLEALTLLARTKISRKHGFGYQYRFPFLELKGSPVEPLQVSKGPEPERFTPKGSPGDRERVQEANKKGSPAEPELEERTRRREPKENSSAPFERFWKAYPKKRRKPDALTAWKSLGSKRPPLEVILTSLGQWKASEEWQRDGGKFIPHPAKWLKGHCWNDEPDAARTRSVSPGLDETRQKKYADRGSSKAAGGAR